MELGDPECKLSLIHGCSGHSPLLTAQGKQEQLQGSFCKDWRGRNCLYEYTQVCVCKQGTSPVFLGEELKQIFNYIVRGWTTQKHHRTLDRCHALDGQGSQAVLSAFGKLPPLCYSTESKFIFSTSTLCPYIQQTCSGAPRSTRDCMWGLLTFFFTFRSGLPS